ncbi:MAG: prephenate dehydrogenase [Kiritimatiellia bacterium]
MNIAVAGLGLIGGSFVKAFTRAGHSVHVWNRTRATAERAVAEGQAVGVLDDDFSVADLVVVALPPVNVVGWIDAHQESFRQGAIVVDATGVKAELCAALSKYAFQSRWTFVGGHPMAGREVNGWDNATADLYRNASMIFTPYPSCGRGPLDRLEALFSEIGFAKIVFTTPEIHDRMIALTSQLAHVVSSAYMQDPLAVKHDGFSAGSFHDMTRVARLDPVIWTELFLLNRVALLDVLDGLMARLAAFRTAIDASDGRRLEAMLAAGRDARLACVAPKPLYQAQ